MTYEYPLRPTVMVQMPATDADEELIRGMRKRLEEVPDAPSEG